MATGNYLAPTPSRPWQNYQGPGMFFFQFHRMPFGLFGAPASFQRLMEKVCRWLPFTTTYLDDVPIHSASMQEHAEHLRLIFELLASAGLTLQGGKCHICMARVNYLGHVFSAAGMEPDPQKVAAVHDWTTLAYVNDLQSFLGLPTFNATSHVLQTLLHHYIA